jgi:hypothetical protein
VSGDLDQNAFEGGGATRTRMRLKGRRRNDPDLRGGRSGWGAGTRVEGTKEDAVVQISSIAHGNRRNGNRAHSPSLAKNST